MSKKRRAKPVEWRNTNTFLFTPEYTYSLAVRNRFTFFHCLGKNHKKMLNYAEKFTQVNNICVVYIYGSVGKQETFERTLARKSGILALHLSGIDEAIETVARFEKWLEQLKSRGERRVISDGENKSKGKRKNAGKTYANEPSESWIEERDKVYRAVDAGYAEINDLAEDYREQDKLWLEEYPKAISDIQAALDIGYDAYGMITGKVKATVDEHSDALEAIARRIYPYGIESDHAADFGYKMAAANKLTQSALRGEIDKRLCIKLAESTGQMSIFDETTEGATKAINTLSDWCEQAMRDRGCFYLGEAWELIAKPPFGAYKCNWYSWIYAYVLRKYWSDEYLYGLRFHSQRLEPEGLPNAVHFTSGCIFKQNDEQDRFRDLLVKMFGFKQRCDTTGEALMWSRRWISDNIKFVPLDALDHKWREVLAVREDEYWYTFGYEKEYLGWLESNFDYFYKAIRSLDDDFRKGLAEKYGEKRAELYCKRHYVKGGAIGWLWNKEYMEESVKKYMEREVCRECGDTLVLYPHVNPVHLESGENGSIRFTLKEIIGLNKKLLGRYQDEYFCIPCLCEVLDVTADRLYEMIHEFKEQGCELF